MKPAPFEYFDPETVEEVLAILGRYGDEAKVLAGGQSLGPLLNMRISRPQVVVDINRVKELEYMRQEEGWTSFGALTRQSVLEDQPEFKLSQPLVSEAIPFIGHRAIRNRSTVGGSVAHADPAAEWPTLVTALDAELVVRSSAAAGRTMRPADFFMTILTTTLAPEELLVEVRLPNWPANTGGAFVELSRRQGDFAIVGVAARLTLDASRRCRDIRLALMGVEDIPVRSKEAEAVLEGQEAEPALFREAAEEASRRVDPAGDLHASVPYRRHLVAVLVGEALQRAADRAKTILEREAG